MTRRTPFLFFAVFTLVFAAATLPVRAEDAGTEEPAAEEASAPDEASPRGQAGDIGSPEPEGSFTPVGEPAPALEAEVEAESPYSDQSVRPTALGMNEKVSLDLRSIEVSEALRFLALKGGLNMAISKTVAGRVQLLLNNVPIKDILDLILITNGLAYEKIGDVYYVMTEQEYRERYGRKFSDARQVRVFKLRYAIPEQTFALFEVLKSELGRLLVDPESGTVLVMDSEENIKRMETALQALEEKRHVKVYNLKYAKAIDVEARLKTRLDNKKVGTVNADERTNAVIVETLPDRMKEIDEVVAALDQKTKEVLIEAKIVKVTLNDSDAQEISWEGLFNSLNGTGFIGNHGINPVFRVGQSFVDDFVRIPVTARPTTGTKNFISENLVFGNLGDNGEDFEVLLKYLRTIGNTKILSSPKIAAINNQEAKIHVGEKQAYVTTTTTTGQTTTTTAESVTFIDVGIQLAVTPTINDDGFVTMKIKPEISSVVDFLVTPSGNRIPIVDSSLAETTVMVKDGVSIIIGGLRRDERVESRKKVPFLGDVPLLGKPFNSFTKEVIHTELLIVMTPHIVYGDKLVTGSGSTAGESEPGEQPFMTYSDYGQPDASAPDAKVPAPSLAAAK